MVLDQLGLNVLQPTRRPWISTTRGGRKGGGGGGKTGYKTVPPDLRSWALPAVAAPSVAGVNYSPKEDGPSLVQERKNREESSARRR